MSQENQQEPQFEQVQRSTTAQNSNKQPQQTPPQEKATKSGCCGACGG
ncbi:hypothetical protein [Pelistega suis]|nr:hypothetical protein [Pelistega suis]MCQ9327813.1 hypothetical protein [Pelistega suis]